MNHGKQFQLFASVFIVEGVIDDEDPAFFLRSEWSDEGNGLSGQACEKGPPVMSGRIEESVGGIAFEWSRIFSADGPPPEIALAENEDKQGTENLEEREALLLMSAAPCQSFPKCDGFPESRKFGQGLDLDRIAFVG